MEIDARWKRATHVLVGGMILLGVACGGSEKTDVSSTAAVTTLATPREAAAWMSIDNKFTDDCQPPPDGKRLQREGVLIQLGTYEYRTGTGGRINYNSITVDGDPYPKGNGYYWVQVIADFAPGTPAPENPDPLDKEHGSYLYPNDIPAPRCWGDAASCSRRLHALLNPDAMVTLWGGATGYKVSANPLSQEAGRVKFVFELNDPTRIQVFLSNPKEAGDFKLEKEYAVGPHTIGIVAIEPQPHNQIDDPSWP